MSQTKKPLEIQLSTETYSGPDPVKDLYKRLIFAGIVFVVLIALLPFMGAFKRRLMKIKFLKSKEPDAENPPTNDRREAYREQPREQVPIEAQ